MATPWAGERVRTLRLLLGKSQVELSQATGISQAQISSIESGARNVSNDQLRRIAVETATPLRFFEVPAVDLPPGTLRFRKMSKARRIDTKRVDELHREAYRVARILLRRNRLRMPVLPLASEGVLDHEGIEVIVREVREALSLAADAPIANLTRRLENASIVVVPMSLPGADGEPEEAVGHFGVSAWPSPQEPAVMGLFAMNAGDRQRFTAAHELGHLTLHSRRRNVRDPEAEANYFAGALLAPRERMVEAFGGDSPLRLEGLARLKARWGISISALIMRGGHLGLIDEQRKRSLFKQLSARGWRTREPVQVPLEEPRLLWTLLERTYGPNPYPAAEGDLGLSSLLLRSLAPSPASTYLQGEAASGRSPEGASVHLLHPKA